PPDEVADPEVEERVRERGDTVNRRNRDGRRVLAAYDDVDEERGGDHVCEGSRAAGRGDKPEGDEERTLGRLALRMSACGPLEKQEADGDRREEHDLAE